MLQKTHLEPHYNIMIFKEFHQFGRITKLRELITNTCFVLLIVRLWLVNFIRLPIGVSTARWCCDLR